MTRPDWRVGVVRRQDLSGERYGRLTVVQHAGRSAHRKALWRCRCDCGTETVVTANALRQGTVVSCGCAQVEAISTRGGASRKRAREYVVWKGMMARCYRPSSNRFVSYGARGIKVCARWHDFDAFLADMGPRPARGTIDRIDGSGNYTPENCRWSTPGEQARNRRTNLRITIGGETRCLSEWCELLGVNYHHAWSRIRERGEVPEKVLQR